MCQYAWFTHSWLLHDIPSLFYTISCGPADAADRLRITVKRLRGPAPGVEDSIMSSFVNDESTWRRTGRPEMTARSCRRLQWRRADARPGDAGAAAVREISARPSQGGDGAVIPPPRRRGHNSSLLRTYGVSAWIPYPVFCLVCPAEAILASVRRMLVCLYSLHASFITSRNSSFSAQ